MAFLDDLPSGVKKVFLAGVGAMAVGAEKSQDIFEDLARRGEEALEQGRSLNEEISRKVRETTESASDEVLRTRFRGMTPEEREAWIARAKKISDDLDVEDADYEVAEDEDADTAEPAADEPEEEAEPAADEPAEETEA